MPPLFSLLAHLSISSSSLVFALASANPRRDLSEGVKPMRERLVTSCLSSCRRTARRQLSSGSCSINSPSSCRSFNSSAERHIKVSSTPTHTQLAWSRTLSQNSRPLTFKCSGASGNTGFLGRALYLCKTSHRAPVSSERSSSLLDL